MDQEEILCELEHAFYSVRGKLTPEEKALLVSLTFYDRPEGHRPEFLQRKADLLSDIRIAETGIL